MTRHPPIELALPPGASAFKPVIAVIKKHLKQLKKPPSTPKAPKAPKAPPKEPKVEEGVTHNRKNEDELVT